MTNLDKLTELCGKMGMVAAEHGGITHSAGQQEWGIKPVAIGLDRRFWQLVDCDGEVWAQGSTKEILDSASVLMSRVVHVANESNIEEANADAAN